MNEWDLSRSQHQDVSAIFVFWFDYMKKFFYHGIYGLIPIILEPGIWWILALLLVGAVFVTGFLALLAYYHFEFYLTESELVILQGLFTKQRFNIPFERIQTVHLHQNIIQRWLGVKGVKVETAGSQAQETELKGLKEALAIQLRSALKKGKQAEIGGEEVTEESEGEKSSTPLVNLSLKDLSLIALTDNHIRNGAVILGFIIAVASQFYPGQSIIGFADDLNLYPEAVKTVAMKGVLTGIAFIILVLLIAFLKNLHFFYDFESRITNEGFQVKGGLVRQNEYTIPFPKIQYLEWKTNFIRLLMDMEAVVIYPAQGNEGNYQSKVEVPGCFPDHSKRIMATVFPEIHSDERQRAVYPNWFYKLFLFNKRALMGIIVAVLLGYFWSPIWATIIFGVYLLWTGYDAHRYVKSITLELFEEGIIFKRGWLFPVRTVFKPHKLQAIKIRQNILQRRRSLCHLDIGTAAGHFRLPFLPIEEGSRLYDWLIYKVEVHKGGWM